jgi:hypothetical protein
MQRLLIVPVLAFVRGILPFFMRGGRVPGPIVRNTEKRALVPCFFLNRFFDFFTYYGLPVSLICLVSQHEDSKLFLDLRTQNHENMAAQLNHENMKTPLNELKHQGHGY